MPYLDAVKLYQENLNAAKLHKEQTWARANSADRNGPRLLGAEPALAGQLDLMLADCHSHLGNEEDRLQALKDAAELDQSAEAARAELARVFVRSGKFDQAVSVLEPLAASRPEWRLDLVRLSLKLAIRQPREQRNWRDVEQALREAEKALPQSTDSLFLLRLDLLVCARSSVRRPDRCCCRWSLRSDAIFGTGLCSLD